MALKDLIAEKGVLDEAAIERIVGSFVRYDVDDLAVTFTPAIGELSNRAKILVYLVALQGWKFVTDDTTPSSARPKDIEDATGIPGGSLRPTLRSLVENHLLSEKDGRYSVSSTSFHAIERELSKTDVDSVPTPRTRPSPRKTRKQRRAPREVQVRADADVGGKTDGAGSTPTRKIGAKVGNLSSTFNRWIDEGYFANPRTLTEVQARFRKEAIIVPATNLPNLFIRAVRKGRLIRDEVKSNGKVLWSYTSNKAPK
jgi:hypothetical protein